MVDTPIVSDDIVRDFVDWAWADILCEQLDFIYDIRVSCAVRLLPEHSSRFLYIPDVSGDCAFWLMPGRTQGLYTKNLDTNFFWRASP